MIFTYLRDTRVDIFARFRIAFAILALTLLCLCLSQNVYARDVRFDIQGIKGDLRDNVENYLESLPSFRADRLAYRAGKPRRPIGRRRHVPCARPRQARVTR